MAFLRRTSEQTVLVILNYSSKPQTIQLSNDDYTNIHILFSSATRSRSNQSPTRLTAAPFEVLIAELRP